VVKYAKNLIMPNAQANEFSENKNLPEIG